MLTGFDEELDISVEKSSIESVIGKNITPKKVEFNVISSLS